MYDWCTVEEGWNTCRRGYQGNCGDKIEYSALNVDVGGFVNNKSRQRTVVFVLEVIIEDTFTKIE